MVQLGPFSRREAQSSGLENAFSKFENRFSDFEIGFPAWKRAAHILKSGFQILRERFRVLGPLSVMGIIFLRERSFKHGVFG